MTEQGIAQRLASEVMRQLDIQAELGSTLLVELQKVAKEGRVMVDNQGEVVGTTNVPSRDWARCYQHYTKANKDLLQEQREGIMLRAKLKMDSEALTDEQYKQELLELGREALTTLTREDLERALSERGLTVTEVER